MLEMQKKFKLSNGDVTITHFIDYISHKYKLYIVVYRISNCVTILAVYVFMLKTGQVQIL